MALERIDLIQYEKKIHAYSGEDGVLDKIFETIGTVSKFLVDIGCQHPVIHSNTCHLREKYGLEGLLLDRNTNITHPLVRHEEVTPDNVIDIFRRYGVPKEFDLLDIDIDSYDYWVWESICNAGYRPRVVCIEFNKRLPWDSMPCCLIGEAKWLYLEGFATTSHVSLSALYQLCLSLGYELVHIVTHNGILVSRELSGPFKTHTLANLRDISCPAYILDLHMRDPFNTYQIISPMGRII